MKKPLKITIIVSVILILAIVLSVAVYLKDSIRAPALLTAKVQKELAIWPQYADSRVWWTEDKSGYSLRYYGTYNGWHILSNTEWENYEDWYGDFVVGEYTFPLGTRRIYAVKGTKTAPILSLYEEGVLDDKDIAKIYEYHMYAEEIWAKAIAEEEKALAEHPD